MIDSLSIAVHTFVNRVSMSFSVDVLHSACGGEVGYIYTYKHYNNFSKIEISE